MSLMKEATAEAGKIAKDIKAAQAPAPGTSLMREATLAAARLGQITREYYVWDDPEQTLKDIRAAGDDQAIDLSEINDFSDESVLRRLEEFKARARG